MAGWQKNGDYVMPNGSVIPNPANATAKNVVAQNDAAARNAGAQSDAATKLAQNTAATTAPGYISPDQAETTRKNQSLEALQKLGIDTSATGAANTLAEQGKEFGAQQALAEAKFGQTKADRSAALAALDKVFGSNPGEGVMTNGGQQPAPSQEATVRSGGPNEGIPGPGVTTPEGGPQGPPGAGVDPGQQIGTGDGGQLPAPTGPPPTPGAPYPGYDPTAETAAYTGARENVGHETAASLKALQGVMAARGIGGSGIEGKSTRDVFGRGLANLAGVNASAAAGKASRAYDWQKTMAPLAEQSRQFDVSSAENRRQFNQTQTLAQQKARLDALLGVYGLSY